MSEMTRGGALRAAWRRIRETASLQPRWVAAADALVEALDSDLDPALVMGFMNRARRLASEIPQLEPDFAAHWSGSLPYRIAAAIAIEALDRRVSQDPPARVTALFDTLLWNLVDADEELTT